MIARSTFSNSGARFSSPGGGAETEHFAEQERISEAPDYLDPQTFDDSTVSINQVEAAVQVSD